MMLLLTEEELQKKIEEATLPYRMLAFTRQRNHSALFCGVRELLPTPKDYDKIKGAVNRVRKEWGFPAVDDPLHSDAGVEKVRKKKEAKKP